MTATHTHTLDDVAALERSTGLQLYGWLNVPPVLLPILGRPGLPAATRRALVLRLNGAGLPVSPDRPPAEDETAA